MTRYSSESRKEHLPDQNRIREMEYFQSMYPQSIKMLQRYVSEECDRMDYKGSPMYDEYPDMLMIERACRNICGRIPDTVFTTGNERPPAHSNWMQDIIRVLLTNEMQNRRCQTGRC